jgi:hypothetical protein
MKQSIYHIGLVKGIKQGIYSNGHKADTVIIQLRKNIDFLSCELWEYLGERETTKKDYKNKSSDILQWINQKFKTEFKHIIID